MSRRRHRHHRDPDQFDLFEPPHERCEDGRGIYLQYLIAPPTELAGWVSASWAGLAQLKERRSHALKV